MFIKHCLGNRRGRVNPPGEPLPMSDRKSSLFGCRRPRSFADDSDSHLFGCVRSGWCPPASVSTSCGWCSCRPCGSRCRPGQRADVRPSCRALDLVLGGSVRTRGRHARGNRTVVGRMEEDIGEYALGGEKPFRVGAVSEQRRVVRGGSWNNPAQNTRYAFRLRSVPDLRLTSIGFRVVLSPLSDSGI